MDDWLITPALNLEGGKMYSFSIEIMTGGSFNETFEVMFGKDKTIIRISKFQENPKPSG